MLLWLLHLLMNIKKVLKMIGYILMVLGVALMIIGFNTKKKVLK